MKNAKPIRLLLSVTIALAALGAQAQGVAPGDATLRTLPSGVGLQILSSSTSGAHPGATSVVLVHYRGMLENGVEFDSSYKRGQPARLPLDRVIPCWTEGLQQLTIGTKARLYCPAATAYGKRGAGGVIPPDARLTFEIELVDILP